MKSNFQSWFVVFSTLLLVGACQNLKLNRVRSNEAGDWLTDGSNNARQRNVADAFDPPLKLEWTYNAGAGFGPGSPLIYGDNVIVATRTGEVHAIDLKTGQKMGTDDFAKAIDATPVIRDGVLFLAEKWGKKTITAYDLIQGRRLWVKKLTPVDAGLLLVNDAIIVADIEGLVAKYSARTGDEIWHYALDNKSGVRATLVGDAAGNVFVANDKGRVVKLASDTGNELWSVSLGIPVFSTPTLGEGLLFVAVTQGKLFAINVASGNIEWEWKNDIANVYQSPPAFADHQLFFGGSDGIVRALDAINGDPLWSVSLGKALTSAPLVTRNTVYFGNMGHELFALGRDDGRILDTYRVKGRIKSAMAYKNGHLIVLSEPRHVYMFAADKEDYASEN